MSDPQSVSVSIDNFYDQMEYLSSKYKIITINQLLRLEEEDFVNNYIAITFDDGYQDNYENAIPVLKEFNIPAIFYVISSFINTNLLIGSDILDLCLLQENNLPDHFHLDFIDYNKTWEINDEIDLKWKVNYKSKTLRQKFYLDIHNILKQFPFEKQKIVIDKIIEWSGINELKFYNYKFMNDKTLTIINNDDIFNIGCHSSTHSVLANFTYNEQFDDIYKGKMMIQDIIGEKVEHFAYPYGQKNHYNKQTIDILKKCNFLSSVTTNLGCYVAKASQYEIPRLTVRDWNINNFIKTINNLL